MRRGWMKRPLMRSGILCLAPMLIAANTQSKVTENLAPLPPHVQNEADHGENEFYEPFPDVSGLYAHGVANPLPDKADCIGSDAEREGAVKSLGVDGLTEFWLYRTRDQGV